MITKYKISIAMAAFNAEKFILEQLNSINNQSIIPTEIVICDDASKDNTSKLINNFKNEVSISIKILKHRKNLGYHRAFETAIKNCSGDIIFISDSDDVWFKKKIENTINIFDKKKNINLIINNSIFTDEKLSPLQITKIENYKKLYNNLNYYIPGCNCAFKKELLDLYLPFPKNFIAYDYWLNKIAISLDSRFVNFDVLQFYRRHGKNYSINLINKVSRSDIIKKKLKRRTSYIEFIKLNIYLKKRLLKVYPNNNIDIYFEKINEENKAFLIRNKLKKVNYFKRIYFIMILIKYGYYKKYFRGAKSLIKDFI